VLGSTCSNPVGYANCLAAQVWILSTAPTVVFITYG
jgi:hypothetical protein